MRLLAGVLFGAALFGVCADAEDLKQSVGRNWLAMASTKDKDEAIGIARQLRWQAQGVRVVRAVNGYYAVVAGPYRFTDLAAFKKSKAGKAFDNFPSDALLSDGTRYVETIWQPPSGVSLTLQSYSMTKAATFSAGPLQARISAEKFGSEKAFTKIIGKDAKGTFLFNIGKDVPVDEQESAETMGSDNYFRAGLVKLIAGSDAPQVIVTQSSGGAHCCTTTYVLGREAKAESWTMVKLAPRDGDGFSSEDIDGDGTTELIGIDNNFLYAFDSYAGSLAPIQIFKWRDGKVEDVSKEPAFHSRLMQDLASMEWEAKLRPEMAKTNGYLAGWVAAKIRLGQGEEAWPIFMRDYERQSSFGPQECTSGQKFEDCPAENLKQIPIPKALAQFLKETGYTPLPKAAEQELQ